MSTRTTTSITVIDGMRAAGARSLRHAATWVALAVVALFLAGGSALVVHHATSADNAESSAPTQQVGPAQERRADPGRRLVEINGSGTKPVDPQWSGIGTRPS